MLCCCSNDGNRILDSSRNPLFRKTKTPDFFEVNIRTFASRSPMFCIFRKAYQKSVGLIRNKEGECIDVFDVQAQPTVEIEAFPLVATAHANDIFGIEQHLH